jgi:hypothetical protein
MQVTWISGWGISPQSLRPLAAEVAPGARHVFAAPRREEVDAALASDWVVAWSLGAWWTMQIAAEGKVFRGRVSLLAPFVAFSSEFGFGGRCGQAQVRWLKRWVQRTPAAAIQDFYERAGLGEPPTDLPYPLDDLLDGLDRLAEEPSPELRRFAAGGLPERWSGVIGSEDALLDAQTVSRTLPGCRILPHAGHAARDLVKALKEDGCEI